MYQPTKSASGVLYCRYSSHSQREVSIDQQIKACQAFAERNGIEIVKVYDDRAMTGTNDRRPKFQQMLSEAERMQYQYVIVYSLDRFARDRYDSAVYKRQLKQHGKKVLSATENISDDPTGILMESLLEGLAEYYSKELSRKIRRGMDDNAEKCMANGSLPYGYRRGADGKYAIVPEEAQVIQEIFRRTFAGEMLSSIYGSLNDRGLRTRKGKLWNKSSFNSILSNIRYTGVYVYKDVYVPGGIPQIIEKEMFDAVQHVLRTKKNPRLSADAPIKRRRENGVYLLTGKIFCGKCKSPMVGISGTSKSGAMHYYYVCKKHRTEKTCDMKSQQRDGIEREVAKAIKDNILVDDVIEQLADYTLATLKGMEQDGALPELRTQIGEVKTSIGNIISAIERGVFSEAMQARLSELEQQRRALEEEIAYEEAKREPDVSRDDLVTLFHLCKDGDIDDKDYQEKLIDAFVVAVYVYDDHLHIVFSPDAQEVDIDLSAVQEADSQAADVRIGSEQLHHVGAPSARLRSPGFVRARPPSTVLRGSSFSPSKHASMGPPIRGSGVRIKVPTLHHVGRSLLHSASAVSVRAAKAPYPQAPSSFSPSKHASMGPPTPHGSGVPVS